MKQYAADDAAASRKSSSATDASKAAALTAEDKAKRCAEARERYAVATGNNRLYEMGPNGERRYLSSEEINGMDSTSLVIVVVIALFAVVNRRTPPWTISISR